jgi:hypothetical protein
VEFSSHDPPIVFQNLLSRQRSHPSHQADLGFELIHPILNNQASALPVRREKSGNPPSFHHRSLQSKRNKIAPSRTSVVEKPNQNMKIIKTLVVIAAIPSPSAPPCHKQKNHCNKNKRQDHDYDIIHGCTLSHCKRFVKNFFLKFWG